MKKVIIAIVISLILVLSAGAFFVLNRFESNYSEPNDDSYTDEQVNNFDDGFIDEEESVDDVNPDASSSGGGGSSGGLDANDVGNPSLTCVNKSIRYSLKNFNENVNCLENELGKCVKLSAICSVDVYNIDENVDSNFRIEYALVDSTDNDLDTIQIENNVNTSMSIKFSANFTIEDSGGIDVLSKCTPRILEVPKKQVCS